MTAERGAGATTTVAEYLKQRLEELGLDRLFGVAGNYAAAFLDTILADPASPIAITGVSNELCAGYAADAYARLKGIGAVAVTYGVGSFSLLNAVAGAFVELAPFVVINGAPTNKEFQNAQSAGLLYSHMLTDANANLDVFRRVTVSSQRIVSAFIFSPSACMVGMKNVGTVVSYFTSSLTPTIRVAEALHGSTTARKSAATSFFIWGAPEWLGRF